MRCTGRRWRRWTARYKIFVHLVGEGGRADIRAQADVYPHLPTTGWVPGEYLSDQVAGWTCRTTCGPGRYTLLVGLYDEATGARLPVVGASGASLGDSLPLETLTLQP